MIRFLFFMWILCVTNAVVYAFDGANTVTDKVDIGRWSIVKFVGSEKIIYRVASVSINMPHVNIVFDLTPSEDCLFSSAIMIMKFQSYINEFNDGDLILEYKLPKQDAGIEMVKTVMEKGDRFAFLTFKKLIAEKLLYSKGKGELSIWIPASGDGTVKRSKNMYFSLDGFPLVYSKAKELCEDSK